MAGAKKRKRPRIKPPAISPEMLWQRGEDCLKEGRFVEALAVYKQLLKNQPGAELREHLARAYLGRARQLAVKRMYKEAADLWERMNQVCETRQGEPDYLHWLLLAGRVEKALNRWRLAGDEVRRGPLGRELEVVLGAHLMIGDADLAAALPADSPLPEQRRSLDEAIAGLARGNSNVVRERLKRIPFRSPYRDLRTCLQAVSLLGEDPRQAEDALVRVDPASPYARFASLLRVVSLPLDVLFARLADYGPAERTLICALRGVPRSRMATLEKIRKAAGSAGGAGLFRVVLAHVNDIGAERARAFLRAQLPRYPELWNSFEQRFGVLPDWERYAVAALHEELQDDSGSEKAMGYWGLVADQLSPGFESDPLKRARYAAVLRRLLALDERIMGKRLDSEFRRGLLERLIEVDPDDLPSYLDVLEMMRHVNDRKAEDHLMERAVKRFPNHPQVLEAAARAAYRRKAFKKAAGYARHLVERNPIDRQARRLLIDCHLAHARKLVRNGKMPGARKEFDLALLSTSDDRQRAGILLVRGWFHWVAGLSEPAEVDMKDGLDGCGGGLAAEFRWRVEAIRWGVAGRAVEGQRERLADHLRASPRESDLLEVAALARELDRAEEAPVARVLEALRGPFGRGAHLPGLSREAMRDLCDLFESFGLYRLLKIYAKAARQRFGRLPAFVFAEIFGRCEGDSENLSRQDHQRLDVARDQAIDDGDSILEDRINRFLGPFNLGRLRLLLGGES